MQSFFDEIKYCQAPFELFLIEHVHFSGVKEGGDAPFDLFAYLLRRL